MAKQKRKTDKATPTAATADKYQLYGLSVQEPVHEAKFLQEVYVREYDAEPTLLREDFCGTFAICCEWVKLDDRKRSVGYDLDNEPLEWGREHHLERLEPAQKKRVKLEQKDVRQVSRKKADVLAAQNFSFWIFKTRSELLAYFRAAYRNLAEHGVMVLDMMGGGECYIEANEDLRKIKPAPKDDPRATGLKKAFTYVWEQYSFNPITHDAIFHIHFRFKDGSEMEKAFTYDWRFWTIPEVTELLAEAGFARSDVYWEVETDDGDGTGEWEIVGDAPSDPSWIAYIAAVK